MPDATGYSRSRASAGYSRTRAKGISPSYGVASWILEADIEKAVTGGRSLTRRWKTHPGPLENVPLQENKYWPLENVPLH